MRETLENIRWKLRLLRTVIKYEAMNAGLTVRIAYARARNKLLRLILEVAKES